MAICKDCNQEMQTADSCTVVRFRMKGKIVTRSRSHFEEPSGRCGDCGIKHGGIHHSGCDVERCPICGHQLLSCDC